MRSPLKRVDCTFWPAFGYIFALASIFCKCKYSRFLALYVLYEHFSKYISMTKRKIKNMAKDIKKEQIMISDDFLFFCLKTFSPFCHKSCALYVPHHTLLPVGVGFNLTTILFFKLGSFCVGVYILKIYLVGEKRNKFTTMLVCRKVG